MSKRADDENRNEGATDWERVDRMTDEEIEAAARSDADCEPLTPAELSSLGPVPEVKQIRLRLGMTQEQFAEAFGLSLASVRDWEQGRYEPDKSVRSFLRVISALPDAVQSVLHSRPDGSGPSPAG
ncbi:MAG: helix-turn-helix domain-containing protein [Planctomycetota bacterium]